MVLASYTERNLDTSVYRNNLLVIPAPRFLRVVRMSLNWHRHEDDSQKKMQPVIMQLKEMMRTTI